MLGLAPAASSILSNPTLKISLLPSSQALAGAEVELVSQFARELCLQKALAPLLSPTLRNFTSQPVAAFAPGLDQ